MSAPISVSVENDPIASLKERLATSLSYQCPEKFPKQTVERIANEICSELEDFIYNDEGCSSESAKTQLLKLTSSLYSERPQIGAIIASNHSDFQEAMAEALEKHITSSNPKNIRGATEEDARIFSVFLQIQQEHCNPETGRMNILLLPNGQAEVFTTGAPQQQQQQQQQQQARHIPQKTR